MIPVLASEYTDPANLPVFENILKQLVRVAYISHVIFGLDRASEKEAFFAAGPHPVVRAEELDDPME
jgi:glucosyl-3-phosphoglycerate synthase